MQIVNIAKSHKFYFNVAKYNWQRNPSELLLAWKGATYYTARLRLHSDGNIPPTKSWIY